MAFPGSRAPGGQVAESAPVGLSPAHPFTHAHEDASGAFGLGMGLAFAVNAGVPGAATAAGRVYPPSARVSTWASRFTPELLSEMHAHARAHVAAALPPGHPRVRELPSEFISILPLDQDAEERRHVTGSFGYVTSVFKGVSVTDGVAYAVRRVEGVRATPAVMEAVTAAWRRANHPCIAGLHRVFQVGSGPSAALFFVHTHTPAARSLAQLFLTPPPPGTPPHPPVPEEKVWSIAVQLLLALRAAHDAGVSFRGLLSHRVLIHSHGRVIVTGAGVLDVLESDGSKALGDWQQADVLSLGQLLMCLCTRSPTVPSASSVAASLEAMKSTYSPALQAIIVLLLSKPVSIQELFRIMAPQIAEELDAQYAHADLANELLGREVDNGRLLRLLIKMGFVNERPSHEHDPSWSETGDRYLLKLYRDFVFHQVADNDRPVLDLAHVIESLNLLDEGSPEKVLLSSRDGNSILVSSYATLRTALNSAFEDLRTSASHRATAAGDEAPATVTHASGHRGGRGGSRIRGRGRGRGGYNFTYHQQPDMSLLGSMLQGSLPTLPDASVAAMAQMMSGGSDAVPAMDALASDTSGSAMTSPGFTGAQPGWQDAVSADGYAAAYPQGDASMQWPPGEAGQTYEQYAAQPIGYDESGNPVYADPYAGTYDPSAVQQQYLEGGLVSQPAYAYGDATAYVAEPVHAEGVQEAAGMTAAGAAPPAASLNVAAAEFRPSWLT